jgi:hypothetical protein
MSSSVDTAFVQQYNANIMQLSQQMGSRFESRVRNESQKGESQFFDRLGAVTAQLRSSRHADTPQIDTPHSRRRVTLNDYVFADLIDDPDKVRMLVDPASDYARAQAMAFGRRKDDEIIASADGNAFGGQNGGTSVAHPNSQKIASVSAGAGANLNVQALRRAKKLFDEADVDPSLRRHCAISASALENLLTETEVTSSDFNVVKALVQGEVDQFLGFSFIRTQRLLAQSGALSFDQTSGVVGSGLGDADTYRRCLCWAEDGLLLSKAKDMQSRIEERADKNYSTQVWTQMSVGSTRLEEEKVVVILADD